MLPTPDERTGVAEGGVKAQESKTRFLAPIIAAVLAARASDNERHNDQMSTM
jgi:hypothetical protein